MTSRRNKILMTINKTRDIAAFFFKLQKNGRAKNINDRISLNTFLVHTNGMHPLPKNAFGTYPKA